MRAAGGMLTAKEDAALTWAQLLNNRRRNLAMIAWKRPGWLALAQD